MKATDGVDPDFNPGMLTFSQAQGYEELPGPLKLGELPREGRVRIWNVFYSSMFATRYFGDFEWVLGDDWEAILREKHIRIDNLPLDEWNSYFEHNRRQLRDSIEMLPFFRIFDTIQFVLRHHSCPSGFIDKISEAFELSRLAYTIDDTPTPTIIPSVTAAEGNTIAEAMRTLREAGLGGSAAHLRKAAECINGQEWAEGVRESIHAVESVARQLDPKASQTLAPALKSLEGSGTLHPALKEAFTKLYGYTSNEQGIRHAHLNQDSANVGMDEAVFMLGACASFSSYLWRKHSAGSE